MQLDIIEVDNTNVECLLEVDADIFDGQIDPNRLAVYLKETNHMLLVARYEGVVVAQVMAVIHRHPDKPTELYIDDLGVSDRLQRKGIATQLLRHLIGISTNRGCEEIWVATEPDNAAARALYRSLGLTERMAVVYEGVLSAEHGS